MGIYVKQAGLFSTIQDLGRTGFLDQGVVQSGAMDGIALRQANLIVGNQETEAGLEMTITGPTLLFTKAAIICVTGGGMTPLLLKKEEVGSPLYVPEGGVVSFKSNQTGMRAYLAVAGGLSVPVVLQSKSTYTRGGMGGYAGRALKQGDTVEMQENDTILHSFNKKLESQQFNDWFIASTPMKKQTEVRMFPGPHLNWLTSGSIASLFESPFTIGNQSDRMGYRLLPEQPLEFAETKQLLSEAVTLGAVQVPADGQPIILMADRQTVGGYPRVLQVAHVDIPVLAQLRPGQSFTFQQIDLEEADALFEAQERDMAQLKRAIKMKWRQLGEGG
ncbi:LOW QUALITY PROTEIN: allophanate hydrolase 2 subunit 2 [Bacillus sp. JCM 19045]|nr:LOW QUALITY PROTEIN: allophanate hydrolase 2 subunit 2 [Bacillus sp. JCM 19045]